MANEAVSGTLTTLPSQSSINPRFLVYLSSIIHLSSIVNSLPGDQNPDLVSQGWLYCVRRGQGRTHKLPHFDWTGPLKQYLISPKRIVPAEIEKPDWAIDRIA
ncbi:hypothetical protein Rs2_42977 [Raphanus sativus]|nr:hypothetical protein Rs2_42977 [Raphanus sativus]